MEGKFITLEGIEGSGKSTQIVLLANYLKSLGIRLVLTREPGGTLIGDQVRKILLDPANTALDPKAELLLYAASRAQHLKEVILPHLEGPGVVLCDRFADATLAYQGYGRRLDIDLIRTLDGIVCAGLSPDITILLDIDAAAGVARARGRNNIRGLETEGRFENESIAFHERVRQGYLALARQEPERFRIVEASRSREDIQTEIRKIVSGIVVMPN
ncbi:MAG TPA: dTMP kinase [Nitrospirota bacterium]|nr:dTMP kinase [Nitrospirota bacterium]